MIAPFALTALFIALPGAALAHSPIEGVGLFYNGMVHPLIVPADLICLLAVGLLIGQHAPRVSRLALPAFALALALGLLAGSEVAAPLFGTAPLLAVVAALGAAIALEVPFGPLLAALAFAAGLLVGLGSGEALGNMRESFLASAGVWLGAMVAITLIGGLATRLTRPWQRVGVRTVGSWLTAAAIVVLALSLAAPGSSV